MIERVKVLIGKLPTNISDFWICNLELKILTLSLYNKITIAEKNPEKNMIAWKLDAPLEAAPTSALHSLCRTSKQAELDIAVIKKGEIECNSTYAPWTWFELLSTRFESFLKKFFLSHMLLQVE